MTGKVLAGGVLLASLLGVCLLFSGGPRKAAAPRPSTPQAPDSRCPVRRPWGPRWCLSVGEADSSVVDGRSYDGEGLTCDFPVSLWFSNIGSHADGAGMCVTTSVEMIASYLGLYELRGFRDWCAKQPGGCYPEKLEKQLAQFCKERAVPVPPYVNFSEKDPAPLLAALDAAGLPYAHSYDQCPRYKTAGNPRGKIAHMVFSVKYGGKYAVVVDNNEIGGVSAKTGAIYEWMPCGEEVRRMKFDSGIAWVFAFLVPPPPPVPKVGG